MRAYSALHCLGLLRIPVPCFATVLGGFETSKHQQPNGLAFSCRERAGGSLQKTNDLAREAVSCNAGLGRHWPILHCRSAWVMCSWGLVVDIHSPNIPYRADHMPAGQSGGPLAVGPHPETLLDDMRGLHARSCQSPATKSRGSRAHQMH